MINKVNITRIATHATDYKTCLESEDKGGVSSKQTRNTK